MIPSSPVPIPSLVVLTSAVSWVLHHLPRWDSTIWSLMDPTNSNPSQLVQMESTKKTLCLHQELITTWPSTLACHQRAASSTLCLPSICCQGPPKGQLYSLSAPERKGVEDYIKTLLANFLIKGSTSPGRADIFFFIEEKDKTLQTSID